MCRKSYKGCRHKESLTSKLKQLGCATVAHDSVRLWTGYLAFVRRASMCTPFFFSLFFPGNRIYSPFFFCMSLLLFHISGFHSFWSLYPLFSPNFHLLCLQFLTCSVSTFFLHRLSAFNYCFYGETIFFPIHHIFMLNHFVAFGVSIQSKILLLHSCFFDFGYFI